MNIVIDMNLSPLWVEELRRAGFYATHWSAVGEPDAPDAFIMEWAKKHESVVFTHDLDFGTILAATNSCCPSVIQVRTADPTPQKCGSLVVAALKQCSEDLEEGALVTVSAEKMRVRVLPIC
ncbi:MAG: hypothetical protein EOL87_18695 [Spartobacteria bacterium]|nr:hypothetical protein [Spartobacteria bacterium]